MCEFCVNKGEGKRAKVPIVDRLGHGHQLNSNICVLFVNQLSFIYSSVGTRSNAF
jgi:hypothetical protein